MEKWQSHWLRKTGKGVEQIKWSGFYDEIVVQSQIRPVQNHEYCLSISDNPFLTSIQGVREVSGLGQPVQMDKSQAVKTILACIS